MSEVDGSLLERARAASDRQEWAHAYTLLVEADRASRLGRGSLPFLAEAAYFAGHPETSRSAWERVHGAAVRDGDTEDAARAALQVSGLLIDAGLLTQFQGWASRVEHLLELSPGSAMRGQLAVQRSFVSLVSGRLEQALDLAREAIDVATRSDDASTLALARIAEARALVLQGHVPEGLALMDEASVSATSGELDPITTAIVYCSVICSWQALAEYERAEEWTEAMRRWADGREGGAFHGWCRVHRAEILRLHGACHDAEREVRRAFDEIRTYAKPDLGWPLNELGHIRLRLGDLAGAEEAFLQAYEASWEPQPGMALLRLAQGDAGAAMASILEALENPSQNPSWEVPPNTELRRAPRLAAQVEIAVVVGDISVARSAADELQDVVTRFPTRALRASAAMARGTVELAEGDATAAVASFEESFRSWHELNAPYEAARARVGLAEAHRGTGNTERAALEIRAARSTFERLGAKLESERVERLLGAEATPGAGVTRREKVFMFTDIVRSTDLIELLGDDAWGHLVRWHNETIAALVEGHAGQVVRSTGDGFFMTFDTPSAAIGCAVAIQRALIEHRRAHGFSPWVRIGLHQAEASSDGPDWSGIGVHAAARIGALAEGEEILASRGTVVTVARTYRHSSPRLVSLKGIALPLEIVAIEWR